MIHTFPNNAPFAHLPLNLHHTQDPSNLFNVEQAWAVRQELSKMLTTQVGGIPKISDFPPPPLPFPFLPSL